MDGDEEAAAASDGDVIAEPAASTRDEQIERNDIAIRPNGDATEEIRRFYAALAELTGRRAIGDEISRHEAIGVVLVEPRGRRAGDVFDGFPPFKNTLHSMHFFNLLYQQYDERFVFGAPLLANRNRRRTWLPESPVFRPREGHSVPWPAIDYPPRLS